MKSFSKRVASFTMAAAMVLSLAAVSPVDAQAAKKASITKKTSITAGKTYTYKIKNVTSKQYVKVTGITSGVKVKYNNKTVKKNSTKIYGKKSGAALALKVTAKDKVANYKATIKAQVYNKSNNKKVGSLLKTTATVKCTKLAIKSVEPATLAGSHKYIVVNFNRALDKLDPSEVSIRNKATNMLVTVEKVALASNGKSATLTLLGDRLTSGETFVEANTDYVLTVTQSKASAAMDFNFPAVIADGSVIATDSSKSTITVGYYPDGYSTGTFTVPTTISVDYQDILGRTVTFWYDKNHTITKLVVANETPVYGAFNVVSDNNSTNLVFVSKKDSNVKYTSNAATTGTIYATNATADPVVSGNNANYVKLVLNPNGTVRTYQAYKGMTNTILVESVSGKIVRQSKTTSVSLDKYTIVKDGKTITVDQIVKGDVVVYDTTAKFAEVYNDTVSGVITGVTATKITIDGKAYDYKNQNNENKYIKDDVDKTLEEKVLAAYMASKEPATLYFDRAGKLIFAAGKEAAVATNTTEYILTQNAGNYGAANKHYLSLTGSNGTDKIGDIALDGVTFKNDSQTYTTTASGNATAFSGDWGTKTVTSDYIMTVTTNSSKEGAVSGNYCQIDDIQRLDVVSVTRDSKTNDIKEVKVESATQGVSTNFVFKAGLGKVTGYDDKEYKLPSSTPVYEVGKNNVVTKTEYSAFTKSTDKTMSGRVYIFINSDQVITKVIIDNADGTAYGVASDKEVVGVVTSRDKSTIDGDHLVTLSVMDANGAEVAFTSFTDNCKATIPNVGQIIKVKYAVEADKNVADVITVDAGVVTSNTCSGNLIRDNVVVKGDDTTKLILTENAKIVVINNNGTVKTISYSELQNMVAGKTYGLYVHEFSQSHVDFVIIKEDLGNF